MPIFEGRMGRILFIHIPKTGGTSIKELFRKCGYKVTKNEPHKEKEAQYASHATREYWKEWGEFDSKFTVVRNPIERMKSELRYQDVQPCDVNETIRKWISEARKDSHYKCCHVRPQADFIDETVEIYKFEDKRHREKIKIKYEMEGMLYPHLKKSKRAGREYKIEKETEEIIVEYYKEDYLLFEYEVPTYLQYKF